MPGLVGLHPVMLATTAVPGFFSQLLKINPSVTGAHLGGALSIAMTIIGALKAIALIVALGLIFWGLIVFVMASFHFGGQKGAQVSSSKRIGALTLMGSGVLVVVLVFVVGTLITSIVIPNI